MLLGLALVGCQNTPSIVLGPAEFVDGSASEQVRIEGSVGPAPHTGVVRAVNAWGAAVTAASAPLTVNGSPATISFDGLGYGSVVQTDPGASLVEGAGAPTVIAAYARQAMSGLSGGTEGLGDAIGAAPATGGVLVASGASVFWADALRRYPVLTFPDGAPVRGLQSGNLDADGIVDAIAWSADTLVLLRGRNGGGLAWGAALKADESVVTATIGDADDDGHADIAVIWDGVDGPQLEVLWGGAGWDFERSEAIHLESGPIAIGIGDATGSGESQVTVTRPGSWERFFFRDRGVNATGPNFSDLAFADGGGIHSSDDINGDGGAEIITWGPFVPDGDRSLFLIDLLDDTATTVSIDVHGGRFAFGDPSGDGQPDALLQFGDRELIQFYADPDAYHQTRIGALGQTGEMALSDLGGDAIPELFVAGAVGEWWTGTRLPGGNGQVWAPRSFVGRRVVSLLTGPVLPLEVDGDPTSPEFLAFAQEGTATRLRAFEVGVGPLWAVTLGAALEEGVDLAICGDYAYALTPTALHRVSLNNHNVPASVAVTGTKIDCGAGPNGAVVAVLGADVVQLYNEGLGLVGTEDHVGARDVALYEGVSPSVGTCDTDGCSVVRWAGPDGDVLVESDGTSTTFHLSTGDVVAPIGGALGTGDVDGDGTQDLTAIVSEDTVESRIGVWRGLGDHIGPTEVYHTPFTGEGPLMFVDADADGTPDPWLRQGADLFIPGG